MARSLTFPYLFLLLAVSYLGGILLFRELTIESIGRLFLYLDSRIIDGNDGSWIPNFAMTFAMIILIFFSSKYTYSRSIGMVIAAIKCVLFGIASAYLLAQGLSLFQYATWWFPFQILIAFSLLLFAYTLAPPFFMKTYGRVERNNRLFLFLVLFIVSLLVVENLLYFFVIR